MCCFRRCTKCCPPILSRGSDCVNDVGFWSLGGECGVDRRPGGLGAHAPARGVPSTQRQTRIKARATVATDLRFSMQHRQFANCHIFEDRKALSTPSCLAIGCVYIYCSVSWPQSNGGVRTLMRDNGVAPSPPLMDPTHPLPWRPSGVGSPRQPSAPRPRGGPRAAFAPPRGPTALSAWTTTPTPGVRATGPREGGAGAEIGVRCPSLRRSHGPIFPVNL